MNPIELLQIIHDRGEQWWANPEAIQRAREAAQKLAEWIKQQQELNKAKETK